MSSFYFSVSVTVAVNVCQWWSNFIPFALVFLDVVSMLVRYFISSLSACSLPISVTYLTLMDEHILAKNMFTNFVPLLATRLLNEL